MKAISLDMPTAYGIVSGEVTGVMRPRSVPREMIGRKVVIHAKARKTGTFRGSSPSVGVGYATFGEAVAQLNGDCWWPVTSFEKWAKLVRAPARTGFWVWGFDHG